MPVPQSSARAVRVTTRLAHGQPDLDRVRSLCWAYRDFLFANDPTQREIMETFYPRDYYADLMDRLDQVHARPDGAIMVAELRDDVIGCGMTHRLDTDRCELKRLFVHETARGAGAGEALCAALIDRARADGYRTLLLDTSKAFIGARALYTRLGFRERGPYQPVPDIAKDLLCYYEFTL